MKGSMSDRPIPNVDEVPRNRCGGGHGRAHQMSTAAGPLSPFEIAIAGRGAAFAGLKTIVIHGYAHRAAGIAPLEPGLAKDSIEPFALGLCLYLRRSGNDHSTDPIRNATPGDDLCSHTQI